jgi:uncharacterized repeat protein (TIGR03803 family)
MMRCSRLTSLARLLGAGVVILSTVGYTQTVTRLFAFSGNDSSAHPGIVVPAQGRDGKLYGTTVGYGTPTSAGSVFRIGTDGVGSTLFNFTGTAEYDPAYGLTLATDGNFYGVVYGGSANLGAVYRITPGGAVTVVYNFLGLDDGAFPYLTLTQASDGSLYGITSGVSSENVGTIFKYSAAGSVTTIYSLNLDGSHGVYFSSPVMQAADSNLYTTTYSGGAYGCGTILKLSTSGELLQQYDFRCTKYGSRPSGKLVQAPDGNFYGTTEWGGDNTTGCYAGCGTVFQMTQNGTVTLLHKFENSHLGDGAGPEGGLVLGTDGNLYGVTSQGGFGYGTIYQITTGGSETVLFDFLRNDKVGRSPAAGLLQHTNGKFYGTNYWGGAFGAGTVYSLDMGLGAFITFVQPTGRVGQTCQILGQALTGTTSVTFNGLPASNFAVNSDTSMTAVVPAGATTGPVVVTTPSGPLTSNVSFRISQ